ncbi:MAG: hypothetical protein GF355_09450, partial [Candidatus Eisenbacteria bacterium]|nr:hypothetical protein [Candidatus Eisenbacteria bacterium]
MTAARAAPGTLRTIPPGGARRERSDPRRHLAGPVLRIVLILLTAAAIAPAQPRGETPPKTPRSPVPADTTGAIPDSLRALPDSLQIPSQPPIPIPLLRPGRQSALWPRSYRPEAVWRRAAGQGLLDAGQREFLLLSEVAGGYGIPQRLYRTGPGYEVWSRVTDGMVDIDPGEPWAFLPGWSPLWIQSLGWLPYDPVWAPLGAGGSGILWRELQERGTGTFSGVRLTTGPYDTTTEEAWLERRLLGVRAAVFYGDSRSQGRLLIGPQSGQDLLLRVDRAVGRSLLRAEWLNEHSEVEWFLLRKLWWDHDHVRLRGTLDLGSLGRMEGRYARRERQWRWYGEEGLFRRRISSHDLTAIWSSGDVTHLHRLEGSMRLLFTREHWRAPNPGTADVDQSGMALAMGWRARGGASRTRLSAGLELRGWQAGRFEPV